MHLLYLERKKEGRAGMFDIVFPTVKASCHKLAWDYYIAQIRVCKHA